MWSPSSWDKKIHRTSFRLDDENTLSSQHVSVDGRAGVDDDRLGAADHYWVHRDATFAAGARLGMSHVSGAMICGAVAGIVVSIGTSFSSGSRSMTEATLRPASVRWYPR